MCLDIKLVFFSESDMVHETGQGGSPLEKSQICPGFHDYILFVGTSRFLCCPLPGHSPTVLQSLLWVQFDMKGLSCYLCSYARRVGPWYVGAEGRLIIWHVPNIESMLSSENKQFNKWALILKMRGLLHRIFLNQKLYLLKLLISQLFPLYNTMPCHYLGAEFWSPVHDSPREHHCLVPGLLVLPSASSRKAQSWRVSPMKSLKWSYFFSFLRGYQ